MTIEIQHFCVFQINKVRFRSRDIKANITLIKNIIPL
jgi:hypothetical protein